jgi:hypothetical protein
MNDRRCVFIRRGEPCVRPFAFWYLYQGEHEVRPYGYSLVRRRQPLLLALVERFVDALQA